MAFRLQIAKFAFVAVAASLAGACSPGDVQLEGKVFDALGVSGNQASRETPKVAARSPLIVPPSLERLPEPGQGQQAPNDGVLASINDPDRAKEVDEVALAKAQAAYCEKHYAPAKALNLPEADSITGPAGSCRPSVLNAIGWGKQ